MVFKSTGENSTYTNTPYLVGSCAIYTHRVSIIRSIIIIFQPEASDFPPSCPVRRFGPIGALDLLLAPGFSSGPEANRQLLFAARGYESFVGAFRASRARRKPKPLMKIKMKI
jgi:hypothetical protein